MERVRARSLALARSVGARESASDKRHRKSTSAQMVLLLRKRLAECGFLFDSVGMLSKLFLPWRQNSHTLVDMSAIPAADPSCRVSHPFPMHRICVSNEPAVRLASRTGRAEAITTPRWMLILCLLPPFLATPSRCAALPNVRHIHHIHHIHHVFLFRARLVFVFSTCFGLWVCDEGGGLMVAHS